MTIVHSLSLIGVQAYGIAQAVRPAAQPKDHPPVERFQVEDIVDTSDKRAAAAKRAEEEARETEAAKRREQSERAPHSADNAAVGHREAPGIGRGERRPPGSLVNLLA